MPEQQTLSLPRHLPPTLTQPNALKRSFLFRFLALAPNACPQLAPRAVKTSPRRTPRRVDSSMNDRRNDSKRRASIGQPFLTRIWTHHKVQMKASQENV